MNGQSLRLYRNVKENLLYSDFKNGAIIGRLFFDYYFDDGSSQSEYTDVKEVYKHKMPGIRSKEDQENLL